MLEKYQDIAPPGTVDFLYKLADRVRGKSILHVNSTTRGGGVAEILRRLVPMLQDLGVEAEWEVIKGSEEFFNVTKKFHNALQGQEQSITEEMFRSYEKCIIENAEDMSLDAEVVVVHDPQPAALIDYREDGKWAWRCHIDVSHPIRKVWNFLRKYVAKYDASIFSLPGFSQKLPHPQFLIYPSMDPLNEKNRELSEEEEGAILEKLGILEDKPILLQVSRFDRFKDPVGVIQAYREVKKHNDCQLILAGGEATDDPEGKEVLAEVMEEAEVDPDIHILVSREDIEINALQRAANVVLQKSTKEGFGLTVCEAMWKKKPVVGGRAGGITKQLIHGITGYVVSSIEGATFYTRYLLNNPEVMGEMGKNAREYVRSNFLITRHLADYLAWMSIID